MVGKDLSNLEKLSSEDKTSNLQMKIRPSRGTKGKMDSYLTLKAERGDRELEMRGVINIYLQKRECLSSSLTQSWGNVQWLPRLMGASMFIVLLISRDVVKAENTSVNSGRMQEQRAGTVSQLKYCWLTLLASLVRTSVHCR